MTTIGVIGLGGMGSRFARRFLDAGHDVTVWNRTPARATELVDAGAVAADSPADVARRSDVVITMIAGPEALVDVSEGPTGIAAGLDGNGTVLEMSTVGPAAIERLAGLLGPGVDLLDAPVLGSLGEVERGALRIFVGGPEELFARWVPLLSILGSPLHVGPLGMGARAKLVANSTLFGTLSVLGEALALADGLGLERDEAFAVLAGTAVGPQADRRRPAIDEDDYELRFPMDLAVKDAGLIAHAAEAAGVDMRVLQAARTWLIDAVAQGRGRGDYSEVLAHILGSRVAARRNMES